MSPPAPPHVPPEADALLDWGRVADALEAGHRLPRARIADTLLTRGADALLTRNAWIDGLGALVKTATVFPGNKAAGWPAVNGFVALYDDRTGALRATVDFHLLTKWKTAADSLLAARRLARPDSRTILMVGAGTVARSMVAAYRNLFPDAQFAVWNRSPDAAQAMAADLGLTVAPDLEAAVRSADILCTATLSKEPLIRGEWLRPGQHLDLIGAYTPAMREVDDTAMRRARLFVDSRATTIRHIGELMMPITSGAISESSVIADYYDIAGGTFARTSPDDITIAKNGGGAHLDLMTAIHLLDVWNAR